MVGSGVDGSTFAHGTQALEFEALVKRAGVTPARAIQAGTMTNAEAMGWQDQIGSVEKGKIADLLITDGDPLEIQTKIVHLIIGGKDVDLKNYQTELYEKYLGRQ